jgi:hypothetical protein
VIQTVASHITVYPWTFKAYGVFDKTRYMTSHITVFEESVPSFLLRACCDKTFFTGLFFDLNPVIGCYSALLFCKQNCAVIV